MSRHRQLQTLKKPYLIWVIALAGFIGISSSVFDRPGSDADHEATGGNSEPHRHHPTEPTSSPELPLPEVDTGAKSKSMRVTAIVPLGGAEIENSPLDRIELEKRASAVERYAEFQVQRLSKKLRLEPEQEDRLFALIASRSPSFDPQMQLMAGGKPIAPVLTAGSVTRTPDDRKKGLEANAVENQGDETEVEKQKSLEDEIAAELSSEQRDAYTKTLAEDEEWWGDVITKLRVNANLSNADRSAADRISEDREIEDNSESDPATSKTGRGGGRRNTLTE